MDGVRDEGHGIAQHACHELEHRKQHVAAHAHGAQLRDYLVARGNLVIGSRFDARFDNM